MLITKEEGKSTVLSRGFCLFDKKPRREHYDFYISIAQMYAVTPQLLNQIDKIRETEL